MPILEYQLVEGQHTDAQIASLLTASSQLYASVLQCPIDRVRVAANMRRPEHVAVAGRLVCESAAAAPYFHFLVLEGRPVEQCTELLEGFTSLTVELLGVDRHNVRGGCWPIPARYWSIGGVSAGQARAQEIAARTEAATPAQ